MSTQSGKYITPSRSFASDSRPQRRRRLFVKAQSDLARQFRSITAHGPQWPINMSRRTQRSICWSVTKRLFKHPQSQTIGVR